MAETRTRNRNARIRRLKRKDPTLISNDSWQIEQLQDHFPEQPRAVVVKALNQCRRELNTEKQHKIMDCLEQKLSMRNAKRSAKPKTKAR